MVFIKRLRALAAILISLFPLGVAKIARASDSLTFDGLVGTINPGGNIPLSSPAAIVVDSKGNVYFLDTNNNRVVEVNAEGLPLVFTISGLSPASLSSPSGIAIDGDGDLYIADTGNSRVVKVTPSGGGSSIGTGSVNLSLPQGIALDQSGDIFIADTGHSHIVEVSSGGVATALTINVSSGAASLSSPRGLAIDISGKLYIADSSNNRVVTVAAGSTTGVVESVGGLNPGLSGPSSVTVDRVGNVYVADTGHNRITELDTAGNGNVLLNTTFLQSTTLDGPLGVAIDNFGAVYIADTENSRILIVDPYLDGDNGEFANLVAYNSSLNKTAVGFGHIRLGSSAPNSLILHFRIGSPVPGLGGVNVFTSGTQGLDFQIVSGENTTCSSASESGSKCTVEISFLPTAPGLRHGALVLYDPDSNPILTLSLYGFSDAPVAALSSNGGSVISTGNLPLSDPYQLALDGAGNMYVGNYSGSNVIKVPAGGGNAAVVNLGSPGSTAVSYITGVALDGAGNLFIGDHENSRILVVTPGGVVSVLNIIGLSPSLGLPMALAPTGTVTFFDNGTALMSEPVTAGVAQLTTLLPASATAMITAVYSGDGNFLISTSSDSTTVVVEPELGFTFTDTGKAAYTAVPGAVARYSFDVATLYGSYPGIVSFSVTGLPTGATDIFTPSTVAVSGAATPVVMMVQTASATAQGRRRDNFLGRGIMLALLFLPFATQRRMRDGANGRMLLLIIGFTASLAGCGSQSGFFLQSPSPTYTLTVTATGGTLQQSQTVTLIVQ